MLTLGLKRTTMVSLLRITEKTIYIEGLTPRVLVCVILVHFLLSLERREWDTIKGPRRYCLNDV